MKEEVFIPSAINESEALQRTSHLAIVAHQDDQEIMAFHGIKECIDSEDLWFSGIVMTNGSGSPRTGEYANFTDEEMVEERYKEQREAANLGKYSAQVFLGFPSSDIKAQSTVVYEKLKSYILKTKPKIIYTHNIFDKHITHIACTNYVLKILREISEEYRAEKIYACEVWRALDWLPDEHKTVLNNNDESGLDKKLCDSFKSQVVGGKDYSTASIARRLSNATFLDSHSVDELKKASYHLDLTSFVYSSQSLINYSNQILEDYKNELMGNLEAFA